MSTPFLSYKRISSLLLLTKRMSSAIKRQNNVHPLVSHNHWLRSLVLQLNTEQPQSYFIILWVLDVFLCKINNKFLVETEFIAPFQVSSRLAWRVLWPVHSISRLQARLLQWILMAVHMWHKLGRNPLWSRYVLSSVSLDWCMNSL
jgi:hypothetical protein